jgi:hypothetical protein
MANTRRIRSAHAQARRTCSDRGGAEVGCPALNGATGLDTGGGDGVGVGATVHGTAGTDVGGGGTGGAGGATPVGADDPGGRQRARGARTPW